VQEALQLTCVYGEHRGVIDTIAHKLSTVDHEIPPTTLRSQAAGQTNSVWLSFLRKAHFLTGSRDLEGFLLHPGLVARRNTANMVPEIDCPVVGTNRVMAMLGKLCHLALEAVADDHLCPDDIAKIRKKTALIRAEVDQIDALCNQAEKANKGEVK